ncbi:MAG: hypothetical protein AAFP90_21290 [Planctomycetota bacterium]
MNQIAGIRGEEFKLEDVLPTVADEAADVIRRSAKDATPFFLYVPLTSPHLPVVPNAEAMGKSDAGKYGNFVAATD